MTNPIPSENQNFTFGYDVSWKVLDDCTNTAVNQTWTIPPALDLGSGGGDEAVFKVVVVNVTNSDPAAQSSTTGPAFTILRGTATSSPDDTSAAGAGGISATASSSPTDSSTTTTTAAALTPASSHTSPDEVGSPQEQQSQQGQGLSMGAKAGIGVGVGVSALFFLLTLLLLYWKRWGRRRRQGQGHGLPDVELPGDNKMEVEKDEDKGPVLEAEATVPGELSAVNHDEFGYGDGAKEEKEKHARVDPSAPRYPSGPVEMPADEVARAELPESPHR